MVEPHHAIIFGFKLFGIFMRHAAYQAVNIFIAGTLFNHGIIAFVVG